MADYEVEDDYLDDDSVESDFEEQETEKTDDSLISDHDGFEALKSLRVDTVSQALKLITNESFAGILYSDFKKLFSLNTVINEELSPFCSIYLDFDTELAVQCEFDMEENEGVVDVDFDNIASFVLSRGLSTKEKIDEVKEKEVYKYGVIFQNSGSENIIRLDIYHLTRKDAIVRIFIYIGNSD
ncbi:MAG: hypothetical protein KZQ93_20235 [Candidatus Thiodiazotropha sp. (ex Monitilora ramsayi)]|nr:hypothetical protein [Candidatus Thiodiazotropha sp. (ex Monitilora ramsayi)]